MPFRCVINNIRTSNLVISRDRQRFRANVNARASANVNANAGAGARAIRPIRQYPPACLHTEDRGCRTTGFPLSFRAVTVPTGPVSYNNLKDLNIFTFLLWLEKLISDAKILASPMPRNHNK